jgi:hypothetical protein
LHQNVLRDPIQRLPDLAAIRLHLKARRLAQPLREPIHRLGANEFHLMRSGRGQPEHISAALGIAGGDEPVERRFQDLARHPHVLGDIAQPSLSRGLPEPEDLQQRPQPADVEFASRTFRDGPQLHPGAVPDQPANRVLQQLIWRVVRRHREPLAHIRRGTDSVVAQRHLLERQRQHEPHHRDRRRIQEHQIERIGVGRRDRRRHFRRQLVQRIG